jgi:hypothetical protein
MVDREGRPLRRVGYVAPEQLCVFLDTVQIVEPEKTQRPVLRLDDVNRVTRSPSS